MGLLDSIKGMFGKGTSAMEGAADGAKEMAGDVAEQAGEVAAQAKDMAEDAAEKAGDMAEDLTDKAKSMTGGDPGGAADAGSPE